MSIFKINSNRARMAVVAICLVALGYGIALTLKANYDPAKDFYYTRPEVHTLSVGSRFMKIGFCDYIVRHDEYQRILEYVHRPDCRYCNKRQQDMNDSICKAIRESK